MIMINTRILFRNIAIIFISSNNIYNKLYEQIILLKDELDLLK
jgi:hypothetical protein